MSNQAKTANIFILLYIAAKIPSVFLITKTVIPMGLYAILYFVPETLAIILFFLKKEKAAFATGLLGEIIVLLFLGSNFLFSDKTPEEHICKVTHYSKGSPVCDYKGVSQTIRYNESIKNAKTLKITANKGFWGYDIITDAAPTETK